MQVHLTMQWDHTAVKWFCWDFLQDQLKAWMSSKVFYRLDISAPFPAFSSVLKPGHSQPLADEKFSCCTIPSFLSEKGLVLMRNVKAYFWTTLSCCCQVVLLSQNRKHLWFLFLLLLFVRPACTDWHRLKIIASGLSIPHLSWKAKVP